MTTELEQRLAALDDRIKTTPAMTGNGFELPPVGDYQALLDRWDHFEGKNGKTAGHLFLKAEYVIQHHELAGKQVDLIYNMDDPEGKGIGFLKADLKKLGVEGADDLDAAGIHKVLGEVTDTPVLLAIRASKKVNPETNEPYRNAYLQEAFGAPMRSEFTPAPGADFKGDPRVTDEDEIEF